MLILEFYLNWRLIHAHFKIFFTTQLKQKILHRTMADNKSIPSHVWMYSDMTSRPSVLVDVAIGTFASGISIIAMIGNSLAMGYYYGKRDLASKLYFHICCIDIATSLLQVPMIISLLNQRRPGIFINKAFCAIHTTIYLIFVRLYPLAVLLLCASRTISIMRPFYRIKKRLVITTLYIFAALIGLVRVVQYLSGFTIIYGADGPYCYPFYDASTADDFKHIKELVQTAKFALWSVIVGAPCFANIVSLIIIVKKLLSKQGPPLQAKHGRQHQGRQRKAATTVFIFTGVFLLFYTPVLTFFIYRSILSLTGSKGSSQYFMFWYSWIVTEVLNLVNAMCDFVVYFTRINDFRAWLKQKRQMVFEYYRSTMSTGGAGPGE